MDRGGCELQQVGNKAKRKKTPKFLIEINQFYILYKTIIKRSAFIILSLIVILFLYQSRNEISKITDNSVSFISGQLAGFGLGIKEVQIEGQVLTNEKQILSALKIDDKTSTLTFDAQKARERILELPAIFEASIRKSFPSQLIVNVIEIEPVARWRVGGETYFIGKTGKKLALSTGEVDNSLPLIIGQGAADDAYSLINILSDYARIENGLIALSRIADRRWDLIYDNGLRVQLPEDDLEKALSLLANYQEEYSIFDKDISLIDLRITGSLVVRLINRDDENTQ
ncbi:MAG: FtsQ-type POTRA domain-containing protein [Devosiaceae bacterium]|nr:FtsQ-type POTRA domain-containing protein [Devosiaceae bacterium]